jgi:uncharacterized protein (TIGR02996 family)
MDATCSMAAPATTRSRTAISVRSEPAASVVVPVEPRRHASVAGMQADDVAQAAAAHANAKRLPEALAVLLDAWRGSGTPELADAIETIGKRLAATQPSLAGKTVAAHRAWRKAAKGRRAEDLDRLLATWRDVPATEVAARAELLREWPADPRRDRAVVAMLCESPYRTTPAVWTQLCALTEMIRDVRQRDRLRAFVAAIPTIFIGIGPTKIARRVRAVLEPLLLRLDACAPAPMAEARRATLAELAREEPAAAAATIRGSRADELRACVFEQPDDYGLRAIYADALIEAGDPLGELIALSLKHRDTPPSKPELARRLALTKRLLPAILGPLAKVLYRTELEVDCGFLSRCTVNFQECARTIPLRIEELAGSPWWSTVVELRGPAKIFLHPVMRSLRRLYVYDDADLAALLDATSPPAIDTLSCNVTTRNVAQLARATRLTVLRHLHARSCNAKPRALLEAPVMAQLETLVVWLPWVWQPWVEALLARPCAAQAITLFASQDRQPVELRLRRGPGGRHSEIDIAIATQTHRFELERRVRAAVSVAHSIGRRVTRLTITPSRKLDRKLQALIDAAVAQPT